MISILPPLALTAVTGGMVSLTLVPAIREAIHRKDATPLPVRRDDGNIRNFARSFRRYIVPLENALAECAQQDCVAEAGLPDGSPALLVGKAGVYPFGEEKFDRLVLFAKPVHLRDDLMFTRDLYAAHHFEGGKKSIFRAILGENDVLLEEESRVLRWLHAEGGVIAAQNTHLYGRCSAEKFIHLSAGCRFERLYAPAIVTGINAHGLADVFPVPQENKQENKKVTVMSRPHGRSRIKGDLHLGSGEMFLGDIIATGSISVGAESRIVGSAKANADIELCEQGQINGSLISSGTIRLAKNCILKGPVLAEKEIMIGAGTRIGTHGSPTTISAPRIRIAPDCVIHGTIWARVEGRVEE
jgi:cytoskeletal protein CcmA (bactofilin family)